MAAPKGGGQASAPSDTDITAEFLQPLLTPENVANLVSGESGGAPAPGGGRRAFGGGPEPRARPPRC